MNDAAVVERFLLREELTSEPKISDIKLIVLVRNNCMVGFLKMEKQREYRFGT